MRIVNARDRRFEKEFERIRRRGEEIPPRIMQVVERVVRDVAIRKDRALFEYTKRFDGVVLSPATVEVPEAEIKKAAKAIPSRMREVMKVAAARIERFHRQQVVVSWHRMDDDGVELGQLIRPLARVGIYAPGGHAPYPSTVLMAALPAKVAGVGEIILATPARKGGISPLICAAASLGGVNRIFTVGGAQAIAALAYGTESVPQVDKIVGPGNIYVAMAKKLVYGTVAIDMIAGPSEILVIADGTLRPDIAAADLLSQAEHDEMASSILLTPDAAHARDVAGEVKRQLKDLSKSSIASKAIARYGMIVVTGDLDEAVTLANRYAPEHLELLVKNPRALLRKVTNAGAVFMGGASPEALGDYIAGPNHILPTGGTARFSSPLGVYDFIKRTSVISFSRGALRRYGEKAAYFAAMEGLGAHERSITMRLLGPANRGGRTKKS